MHSNKVIFEKNKLTIEKKAIFSFLGIIFGTIGIAIFFNFKESKIPLILSSIMLSIGIISTLSFLKVTFDKETKTYELMKCWRFMIKFTKPIKGNFNEFRCITVAYSGPSRNMGAFCYFYLETTKKQLFIPFLHNGIQVGPKAYEELKRYADFFDLPVRLLNIPENLRGYFQGINTIEN